MTLVVKCVRSVLQVRHGRHAAMCIDDAVIVLGALVSVCRHDLPACLRLCVLCACMCVPMCLRACVPVRSVVWCVVWLFGWFVGWLVGLFVCWLGVGWVIG